MPAYGTSSLSQACHQCALIADPLVVLLLGRTDSFGRPVARSRCEVIESDKFCARALHHKQRGHRRLARTRARIVERSARPRIVERAARPVPVPVSYLACVRRRRRAAAVSRVVAVPRRGGAHDACGTSRHPRRIALIERSSRHIAGDYFAQRCRRSLAVDVCGREGAPLRRRGCLLRGSRLRDQRSRPTRWSLSQLRFRKSEFISFHYIINRSKKFV